MKMEVAVNVGTPPAHLSARSRKLWGDVVAEFQFEAVDLERLRLACEALDRCEQARAIVAKEGPIIRDRFGQTRPHPAIAIERDARIAALRGLRELGIEAGV
jgi:P27 family predicted phage terminase small subunit